MNVNRLAEALLHLSILYFWYWNFPSVKCYQNILPYLTKYQFREIFHHHSVDQNKPLL